MAIDPNQSRKFQDLPNAVLPLTGTEIIALSQKLTKLVVVGLYLDLFLKLFILIQLVLPVILILLALVYQQL